MLHTYLVCDVGAAHSGAAPPFILLYHSLSLFFSLSSFTVPSRPCPPTYSGSAAQSSSPPAHSAHALRSSPKVDFELSFAKETGIAGALQNAATAPVVCRACVSVCVCGLSMSECIPGELCRAVRRENEASVLEDVCRLQAEGMQMFLTSVAGKAA